MVDRTDKGLILGGNAIKHISGPVSIYILKPDIDFHKEFKAPIFVLFGDNHNSKDNLCTDCACCYEVFSDKFLQIIDGIASDPKYPIDFSIEGGLSDLNFLGNVSKNWKNRLELAKNKSITKGYPLPLLRERILPCYARNIKQHDPEYYKDTCPTTNIRWHLADPRQVNVAGYKYNYKYTLGRFLWNVYNIIFPIDNGMDIERLKKLLDDISTEDKDIILNSKYLETLKYIFDDDFYKYNQEKSLVFKQLRKFSIKQQEKWEKWIDKYYKYIYNNIIETNKINSDNIEKMKDVLNTIMNFVKVYYETSDNSEKILTELLNKLLAYVKNNYTINYRSNITNFIIKINAINLDLYFLLRSFKTPEGSNNPLVSFGYFGELHCSNISYFLTNIIGAYKVVYEDDKNVNYTMYLENKRIELNRYLENNQYTEYKNCLENIQYKEYNRCLEIDKRVNLDKLIHSYKEKSPKRKSLKRKNRSRKSLKRKSRSRKSRSRKSRSRKSPKRKSPKRKSRSKKVKIMKNKNPL